MLEIIIPTDEQGLSGSVSTGTVTAVPVQVFSATGDALNAPDGVLQVQVMGGTLQSTVSFSGTIQTDIGNVKITDQDNNFAVMPAAGVVKSMATTALAVQHVDLTGAVLAQATQTAILNSQGTLAAEATLRDVRSSLAAAVNNQGTQAAEATLRNVRSSLALVANNQGTQAQEATLERVSDSLTVIVNNQGTQGTDGLATAAGIAVVANNQGTQATENTLVLIGARSAQSLAVVQQTMNNQGTLATSAQQTTQSVFLTQISAATTRVLNNQGTQATETTLVALRDNGTRTAVAVEALHVDSEVSRAVLEAIVNNQGTQATAAGQTIGNAIATVTMNSQGTLATAAAQTAQTASLTAILNSQGTQSNAPMTVVMNNQGTQATAAGQAAGNSSLALVANNQGTQATLAAQAQGNSSLAVIVNNQGTQATAANQVTANSYLLGLLTGVSTAANQVTANQAQASVTRTYGASGTASSANLSTLMGLDPSAASTDSFGRLRVSNPDYRFDAQLTYNIPPDLWDISFNSTGTVTYDRTDRQAVVTCAASGTSVLQSHKYAPYTPGRSQLALITFTFGTNAPASTAKRVGYYDGTNGIYLEQTSAGLSLNLASSTANGLQTVPQNAWNIDKMDGLGFSGITLSTANVQIMAISLQALYAGRVVVGFDIDGILWPVHQFVHANRIVGPYIANASLPIRYEAISTGADTTSFKALCASVVSEGGGALADIPGRTFTASRTATVSINARLPVLSIRATKFFNSIPNSSIILPNTFGAYTASQPIILELVRNATLTNASWTQVDDNSTAQFDTSATALSGGSSIYSCFIGSGGAAAASIPISENLLDRLIITYSQLLDTADTLTIAARTTGGASATLASLTWKEIR